MPTLLLASHNSGKLAELSALLEPLGVTCRNAAGLGLHQPEKVETTFLGNARIKARAAFEATGLPALADDSGFAVDALNGAPGVRTAEWCITAEGTTDFNLGMDRIYKAVVQTGTAPPWRARLVCALLLIVPDGSQSTCSRELCQARSSGPSVVNTGVRSSRSSPLMEADAPLARCIRRKSSPSATAHEPLAPSETSWPPIQMF